MKRFSITLRNIWLWLTLIALMLILCVCAFADTIPSTMTFLGRLTNPDGTPILDTTAQQLTFRLFANSTGGSALWTQTSNNVVVHNGTFSVHLNFATGYASGQNVSSVFANPPYLEVQVGSNAPLTPRQKYNAVAYAFVANIALTVPDGSITGSKLANGAVTNVKIADVAWNKITGAPATLLTLPYAGTVSNNTFAFSVTNNNVGNGISGISEYGSGGFFQSNAGFSSLHATGNAYYGLYAESTNAYGTGVLGVANSGELAYGVWGISTSGIGVVGNSTTGTAVYGGSGSGRAGYFTNSSGDATVYAKGGARSGLYAESTADDGIGIQGVANNGRYGFFASPIGVYGKSEGGIGVQGESRDSMGVFGSSVNGPAIWGTSEWREGVHGYSGSYYGVYGASAYSYGVYGASTYNYAGYFSGDVYTTGYYRSPSDARYKTNIALFPNALDTILNLRGVTFDWKHEEFKDKNFKAGRQIGFIAQEVEKVLPELVHTDRDGYKSVAYQNVIPVLVEATKAQQKQIETLKQDNDAIKAENAALQSRLSALEVAFRQLQTNRK